MLELDTAPLAGRVYRSRPSPAIGRAWEAIGGESLVQVGPYRQPAAALPAVVGEAEGRTYLLLLGLVEEDLLLLGLSLQPDLCRPGLGLEMLGMALAVARATGRAGVRVHLTNADVVPLYFLQRQGFRLHEVRPLESADGYGFQGLPRTHELVLRLELGQDGEAA
jgi:hypothetical protein